MITALCGERTMTILGNMIRQRRLELDLTQEEIEERTSVSQHYQSQIELGKARPGDGILRALADGLDMPFTRLVLARSGAEPVEEGDEYEVRVVGMEDVSRGGTSVRVSSDLLGSRSPDHCFVLAAPDDSLRASHILCGDRALFARMTDDELPNVGEIVARQDDDRWTMTVWRNGEQRPAGRMIAMWRTTH